jgi:hypothetical protein
MEEKTMVRLLAVETEVEASLLKSALEENDIHVFIKGLGGDSAFGGALDGADEIELFVYEDDVEEAKGAIVDLLEEDVDEIPAWTCKCGEDVDEGFGICWSCGADYEGPITNSTDASGEDTDSQ